MSKHQSLSGNIRVLATAPTSPKEGEEYLDTTKNAYRRFNGTYWESIAFATTTSTSSSTTTTSTSTSTS